MKSQEQLVSAKEAAAIIGVNYTDIHWHRTQGVIQGFHVPGKRAMQFKMSDVLRLKDRVARNKKKDRGRLRGHQVKRRLRELEVTVDQLTRELDRMKSYMGMDFVELPVDEEGVAELYQEAQAVVALKNVGLEEARKWLLTFSVISEKFFMLVTEQFNDPEPWRVFVEAAEVVDNVIGVDADLIKHSEYARRNLRNAVYSAAFMMYGAKAANSMFNRILYSDRLIKTMFMVWDFKPRTKTSH